jgi:hypothetical protein
MRIRLALTFAVALAACSSHQVNLGGTGDGGSASGGGTGSGSGGGATSPVNGTWAGYIESFHFPDGSDAVTMMLTAEANGSISGTVIFGNKPAPPPPTNPDVGYPPGFMGGNLPGPPNTQLYIEGFHYTAIKPAFDGQRLQLGVITAELWKAWCELQPMVYGWMPDGGGPPYNCLPNWGFMGSPAGCSQPDPATGKSVPVDCGKLALCDSPGGGCQCSATSCTVNLDSAPDIAFDMQLMGDRLDGSTSNGTIGSHNVHLTRAP